MIKKTLWMLTMLGLTLVLYLIVTNRMDNSASVIFGGADQAFIQSDSVTFVDLNSTPTPEPTVDIWPALTQEDFSDNPPLSMVNAENLLSSAYKPETTRISTTRYQTFSTDYIDYLEAFLKGIQDAGFEPYVAAGYREYSYQNRLFNTKASQIAYEMAFEREGKGRNVDYTEDLYQEAVLKAKTITMIAGSSEHQLGLAIDLMDRSYSKLVYSEMNQDFFKWVDEHCAEYGFIKRYPTKKLLITGWDEPWHYRYVGKEVATFIMEQGICYEEFYAHYFPDFQY